MRQVTIYHRGDIFFGINDTFIARNGPCLTYFKYGVEAYFPIIWKRRFPMNY